MSEIKLAAKTENIPVAQDFLHEQIDKLECPFGVAIQLEIAIEEIFTNISNYAYGDDTGIASIRIETTDDPQCAVITFTDSGIPYDPLKKEDPDITLGADERPIGGLGIFMVKETMDDMSYEYRDGKNILTLKKILKK